MTKFTEPLSAKERAYHLMLLKVGLRPIFFPRDAYGGDDERARLCERAAAAAMAVFEADRPKLIPKDIYE